MRRETAERMHLCFDPHRQTVDAHEGFTVHQRAAERARGLEAGDHHMALRSAEVVPQVMEHASAVAHAAAGDDEGM